MKLADYGLQMSRYSSENWSEFSITKETLISELSYIFAHMERNPRSFSFSIWKHGVHFGSMQIIKGATHIEVVAYQYPQEPPTKVQIHKDILKLANQILEVLNTTF